MICENGNEQNLDCKGYSNRFQVYFTATSINFGEIKLDTSSNKVLTIMNDS